MEKIPMVPAHIELKNRVEKVTKIKGQLREGITNFYEHSEINRGPEIVNKKKKVGSTHQMECWGRSPRRVEVKVVSGDWRKCVPSVQPGPQCRCRARELIDL